MWPKRKHRTIELEKEEEEGLSSAVVGGKKKEAALSEEAKTEIEEAPQPPLITDWRRPEALHRPNLVHFTLSNVNLQFANALRRTLLSGIPTLAPDVVRIQLNTSQISSRTITQRLMLLTLPITTVQLFNKVQSMPYFNQCEVCSVTRQQQERDADDADDYTRIEVCQRCSLKYTLKVFNNTAAIMKVTERHLQCEIEGLANLQFETNNKPLYYHTLLELGPGENISLSFFARKGLEFGSAQGGHAKWSPTIQSTYKLKPIVELVVEPQGRLTLEQRKGLVASCPTRVLTLLSTQEGGAQQELAVEDSNRCTQCQQCFKYIQDEIPGMAVSDIIKLSSRMRVFLFVIETTGVYTPEQILSLALQSLRSQVKHIQQELILDQK